MRAASNLSRRTFVSRGASLLAAGASMIMLPRVVTATPDAVSNPMRMPGALTHPSTLEASRVAAMEGGHHTNEEMSKCIQLCRDCQAMCTQTIAHCLKLGGRHATSADYMLRESPFHDRMCRLCSDLCKLCAKDYEQMAGDDQMLKQCVEMCRRCAESCERMASKGAA